MADVHILTHEFRPKRGGAGVVCERIADTLTHLGKEVTVWVPEYVGNDTSFCPEYDVRVIRKQKGTRNLPCLLRTGFEVAASRKTLRESDVYLGEPGPILVFMVLTLVFPKFWKRLVITLHGSEICRFQKSKWWSAPLFRRLATKADLIHVLSTHNETALLSWLPELKSKTIRGYGMSLASDTIPPIERGRKSDSAKIKLLCVGRIHPRKGQLQLLKAIAGLSPDVQKRLEVLFVGQFVKDRYYKDLLKEEQHSLASVSFAGGVTDSMLDAAYDESDIFALTSMPYGNSIEGLGLVYLEAARHGLPILANRIGGVGDVVIHGKNGYLADPDDVEGLTRHLDILIRNPLIRKQLGDEAYQMVKDKTWEKVVAQLFPHCGGVVS